jgi:hypothetical protein
VLYRYADGGDARPQVAATLEVSLDRDG